MRGATCRIVYQPDEKLTNSATIIINKEDHTIGNLLRCVRPPRALWPAVLATRTPFGPVDSRPAGASVAVYLGTAARRLAQRTAAARPERDLLRVQDAASAGAHGDPPCAHNAQPYSIQRRPRRHQRLDQRDIAAGGVLEERSGCEASTVVLAGAARRVDAVACPCASAMRPPAALLGPMRPVAPVQIAQPRKWIRRVFLPPLTMMTTVITSRLHWSGAVWRRG